MAFILTLFIESLNLYVTLADIFTTNIFIKSYRHNFVNMVRFATLTGLRGSKLLLAIISA